jgi:hypothetical protein
MNRLAASFVLVVIPALAIAQTPIEAPPSLPQGSRVIVVPEVRVDAPQPAPAPSAVAQPTVIVVQQPAGCQSCAHTPHAKHPAKHHKSKETCDNTIKCTTFRCHYLFQWGSCKTFYGHRMASDNSSFVTP